MKLDQSLTNQTLTKMDRIITITGSNAANSTLTLSDQGTTNTIPGDQVTWVLGPGCGVAAIVGIKNKPISVDVFNPDPAPLNDGTTNWQGTINSSIIVQTEEQYSIIWNSVGGGWHGQGLGPITTDPKIIVNPGT